MTGLIKVCIIFSLLSSSPSYAEPLFRHYQEKYVAPLAKPKTTDPVSWTSPKGWARLPEKPMRLASYKIMEQGEEGLCTLSSLPLMAGDLQANLKRWMGQLNIAWNQNQVKDWIEQTSLETSQGGILYRVFDLSEFVTDDEDNSMLTAIASLKQSILFVKLTGSKALVHRQRKGFLMLVASLKKTEVTS